MRLTFLIVLVALLIAAVGASSATAQRAPCSQKSLVRALPTSEFGLQLYVLQRCGRRVGLPFG
jgi:hypothetical protein